MLPNHTDLILSRLEEGTNFLVRANKSLRDGDWGKFENDAVLCAHTGISALEPTLKDYIDNNCLSKMNSDELQKFNNRPRMPFLLSLMTKYAEPRLPRNLADKLSRYQQIYNAAKHKNETIDKGETPAGYELKNALRTICNLILDYLPLVQHQKLRLSNILNLLNETAVSNIPLDMMEVKRLLGAHIRLVDPSNYSKASREEVRKYYEGTKLSWKIIFSGADVERDSRIELIAKNMEKNSGAQMLCLIGEPGAGKSTLGWRIAFEISSWTGYPLIQVMDSEDANFWYNLEAVFPQFEISLIILVDDVFRSGSAIRALENLNPDLKVTIIATSQLNELPAQIRFPFTYKIEQIEKPSRKEKERVFDKLQENHILLDRERRKRILVATSWWVMMLEATTGKELSSIVFDTVHNVQNRNIDVYHAFEYICFWGQYDVKVPSTILQAINPSFYNIQRQNESRGLISSDVNNTFYGTINSQFSQIALAAYPTHNPRRLIDNVSQVLSPIDQTHRSFIATWFRNLVVLRKDKELASHWISENNQILEEILSESTGFELANSWRAIFDALGYIERVEKIEKTILERIPQTPNDWMALFGFFDKMNEEKQKSTLLDAAQWLSRNEKYLTVRVRYSKLAERLASPAEMQALIRSLLTWLIKQSAEGFTGDQLFISYCLRLIGEQGNQDAIDELLNYVIQWQAHNPHNTFIRSPVIRLVEKRGSPQQTKIIADTTQKWLDEHNDNTFVRHSYIAFIESKFPAECRTLVDSLIDWLERHKYDESIRTAYLGLVNRKGSDSQRSAAITSTLEWAHLHPEAPSVITALTTLIDKHGTASKKIYFLRFISDWIKEHPKERQVRSAYMGLLARNINLLDDQSQINQLIQSTGDWLDQEDNKDDVVIRETYLSIIQKLGSDSQIQYAITKTLNWLCDHSNDLNIRIKMLALIRERGKNEQLVSFVKELITWLSHHPNDVGLRGTILNSIESCGDHELLIGLLNDTEKWLSEHKNDQIVIIHYLWLIARNPQKYSERIRKACDFASQWNERYPNSTNTKFLGSYGRILFNLERYSDATAILSRLLSTNPMDVPSRVVLAWCLYMLGQKKESIEHLSKVMKLALKHSNIYSPGAAYHQLGLYYYREETYRRARYYFEEAIKQSPNEYGNYWELAKTHRELGQIGSSFHFFKETRKRIPDDLDSLSRKQFELEFSAIKAAYFSQIKH